MGCKRPHHFDRRVLATWQKMIPQVFCTVYGMEESMFRMEWWGLVGYLPINHTGDAKKMI